MRETRREGPGGCLPPGETGLRVCLWDDPQFLLPKMLLCDPGTTKSRSQSRGPPVPPTIPMFQQLSPERQSDLSKVTQQAEQMKNEDRMVCLPGQGLFCSNFPWIRGSSLL